MVLSQPLQIHGGKPQHVEFDEHRPEAEAELFEHRVVPFAQIEERDNAHDILGLLEKEAGHHGDDFVLHRLGEGHYARFQCDRYLNAIATRSDRYGEPASRISEDAPLSDD